MNMTEAIQPKSDQLNSDSLLGRSLTIRITGVTFTPGEQPITVHYENENGRPWKPCKSMARVMVAIWGPEARLYTGRMLTLYRDPDVKWGGMAVGGIRISHASHIDTAVTMALTATKGSRKPFTVRPLPKSAEPSAPAPDHDPETGEVPPDDAGEPDATATGDETDRLELRRQCLERAARLGKAALTKEWGCTTKPDGDAFGGTRGEQMAKWIAIAKEADARNTPIAMAG